MKAREALVRATAELTKSGVPDAAGDARRLLAHALGIEAGRLTLHLDEPLLSERAEIFQTLLAQRKTRQPVSQILGRRDFFGRRFRVTPDVLDPRPETETLIARALELPWSNVLDLGTGSGCMLVTLLAERAEATGIGIDLSEVALAVARENADVLGVGNRAQFLVSDWFDNVSGRFDLVVSNPPYIDDAVYGELEPDVRNWEPEMALKAGADGLDAYRRIVGSLTGYLVPGGRVLLEIGWDQGGVVSRLLSSADFSDITVYPDLDGRDRVVEATYRG